MRLTVPTVLSEKYGAMPRVISVKAGIADQGRVGFTMVGRLGWPVVTPVYLKYTGLLKAEGERKEGGKLAIYVHCELVLYTVNSVVARG
jgi:hypothetical protein